MSKSSRGFSLLELLLVLALAGLLWSMGWSAWSWLARRLERDRACLVLQQLAAREQEWKAWHRLYTAQPQQLGCAESGCVSGRPAAPSYRIDIRLQPDDAGSSFVLRAEPQGQQRSDPCGGLQLDQLGALRADGGQRPCCGTALH